MLQRLREKLTDDDHHLAINEAESSADGAKLQTITSPSSVKPKQRQSRKIDSRPLDDLPDPETIMSSLSCRLVTAPLCPTSVCSHFPD